MAMVKCEFPLQTSGRSYNVDSYRLGTRTAKVLSLQDLTGLIIDFCEQNKDKKLLRQLAKKLHVFLQDPAFLMLTHEDANFGKVYNELMMPRAMNLLFVKWLDLYRKPPQNPGKNELSLKNEQLIELRGYFAIAQEPPR